MRWCVARGCVAVLLATSAASAHPVKPREVTVKVGASIVAVVGTKMMAASCVDPKIVKVDVIADRTRLRFKGLRAGKTTCQYNDGEPRRRSPFIVTVN